MLSLGSSQACSDCEWGTTGSSTHVRTRDTWCFGSVTAETSIDGDDLRPAETQGNVGESHASGRADLRWRVPDLSRRGRLGAAPRPSGAVRVPAVPVSRASRAVSLDVPADLSRSGPARASRRARPGRRSGHPGDPPASARLALGGSSLRAPGRRLSRPPPLPLGGPEPLRDLVRGGQAPMRHPVSKWRPSHHTTPRLFERRLCRRNLGGRHRKGGGAPLRVSR